DHFRAGRNAGARTGFAGHGLVELDRLFRAEGRVVERNIQIDFNVAAARLTLLPRAAETEHVAKGFGEVAHVEAAEALAVEAAESSCARFRAAKTFVLRAFLGVGEHLVGL